MIKLSDNEVNIVKFHYDLLYEGIEKSYNNTELREGAKERNFTVFNPKSDSENSFYSSLLCFIEDITGYTAIITTSFLRDFLYKPKSPKKEDRYFYSKTLHNIPPITAESRFDVLCLFAFGKKYDEWLILNPLPLNPPPHAPIPQEGMDERGINITELLQPYYDYLLSHFTEKKVLGDENLTLQDLYINPKGARHQDGGKFDLLQNITSWLKPNENDDAIIRYNFPKIRVIFGYAAQGKTSFCYRLIYHLIIEEKIVRPVFLFRLRELESSNLNIFKENPYETIMNLIRPEKFGSRFKITKEVFRKSILILDGLDEVSVIYNIDKEKLCFNLAKETHNREEDNCVPYRVLITSRREIDSFELDRKNILGYSLQELSITEQQKWIDNYNRKVSNQKKCLINGTSLQLFNNSPKIKPLVKQPILLYILSQLKITDLENFNTSKVYNLIFDTIINKSWDERHVRVNPSNKKNIRGLLRIIGAKMMYYDKVILNHDVLESILYDSGYTSKELKDGAKKDLLLAFYFTESSSRDDPEKYAIEFLHRSFGEYFAAEFIWEEMKKIFCDGQNIDSVLKSLSNIFGGKKFLPDSVINYLIDIIDIEKIEKESSVKQMLKYMNEIEDKLFEKEFVFFKELENNQITKALQNFYGYFSVRYRLEESKYRGIKSWLSMIISKHKIHLQGTNLKNVDLSYLDLTGVNMSDCVMDKVNLRGTNLRYVNLKGAKYLTVQILARSYNLYGTQEIPGDLYESLKNDPQNYNRDIFRDRIY